MESRQKQWRKFVNETQKSQEVVSELSKLYIILHEQVRETIVKCTLNLQYDPTQDCQRHLTTLLDLLRRINDPKDAYLHGVDHNILNKFEEQLYDLSQQVQKLLQTFHNASGIDTQQLQRIKPASDKEEYGLRDELKKSEQRRLRSRSGKRSSLRGTPQTSGTNELIQQFSEFKKSFHQKRKALLKEISGHIQKRSTQVLFSKKYSGTNLQDYFKLRSELFDLQTADQYTRQIVYDNQHKQVSKQPLAMSDPLQQKLFGQFKIKTKYMNQKVKDNILNALVDVKMKLLEEYHNSNMKRLKEGNPDTLITLVKHNTTNNQSIVNIKNYEKMTKPNSKHTASASTMHQLPPSPPLNQYRPQRQASLTRYPMAHKSCKPKVYGRGWSHQKEAEFRETMTVRFSEGRVPN